MAVLSDAIPNAGVLQFLKWLLAGVRKHPHEPGLYSLLYAFFRGQFQEKAIPKILLATAKSVRTDRFYSLTEPLWDTLLRTRPFDEFQRTLNRCESELQDYRIESKLVFYTHILKPALWRADVDWIAESFALIDEKFSDASGELEFEYEILTGLRDYKATRDKFLNGNPLRTQMDQALQDYCLKSEPEMAIVLSSANSGLHPMAVSYWMRLSSSSGARPKHY